MMAPSLFFGVSAHGSIMIEPNHPRRKGHVADTSMAAALIWLGVMLIGVAILVRTMMDLRLS